MTAGTERTEIRPTRPALLLLYLAEQGDWVTRDSLAWLFGNAADDGAARGQLRLLLTRARRYSWAAGVEIERNRIRFAADSDVHDPGLQLHGFQDEPVFLHGFSAQEDLGRWLQQKRDEWAAAWRSSLLALAKEMQGSGRHEQAVQLLRRLLQADSLAEDAFQAYLRSAAHAGSRTEAIEKYRQFELKLEDEFGLRPLAQTAALAEMLKQGSTLPSDSPASHGPPGSGDVPLLGRGAQLQAGLRLEPGNLLLAEGEPGIGKTRLVQEMLAGQHHIWLQGRQGMEGVPWLPVTMALRQAGTMQLARLTARGGPLSEYRAELASLVPGLAQGSAASTHSDPGRVLESVVHAFGVLNPGAAAVVADDAQWLDRETLRLLQHLHATQPLKLFLTARTGHPGQGWIATRQALLDNRRTRLVRLGPLGETEVSELLRHAAGSPPAAASVKRMTEASGGNPLMVVQAVADWRERGWPRGITAGWDVPEEAAFPQSGLYGLLLARLSGMGEDARRVLDAAAVLDHGLEPRLIAGMTALSEAAALDILGTLQRQGMLKGAGFAHGYIREVVLAEMPDSLRRQLHLQAATLLRDGDADSLVVADHLRAAGNTAAAVDIWLDVAASRYAVQPGFEAEAEALYRRIIDTDSRTPAWYQACAYMAGRLASRNEREAADELLITVLSGASDPHSRAFALMQKAFLHYLDGRLGEAEEAADMAEVLVREAAAPELDSDIQLLRCMLLGARQKYAESLEISSSMVVRLRLRPASFALGSWLARLAGDLCLLGRFGEALEVHREQLAVARVTRHLRQQAAAINDTVATLDDLGRIGEGLELGLEGLSLGSFDVTWPLLLHVALARRARGDAAGAMADVRRLLAGTPSVTTRAYGLALLAELQAGAAETDAAYETIASATALARGTDLLDPQVLAAVTAVRFGSQRQVTEGLALLASLDASRIPANLRGLVAAALDGTETVVKRTPK